MVMIGKIFPAITDEEKIGDIASSLSGCSYSIGDFAGPFFGGLITNLVGF